MASSNPEMEVVLQELPKVYGKAFTQIFPLYNDMAAKVSAGLGDTLPSNILDLGTGPGEPALTLATAYPAASILATDSNNDMLAKATARAADAGVDNVEIRNVDVCDLGSIPDGSQDVVTASLLLHIVDESQRAPVATEIARVLKPSGVLVASVWESMPHLNIVDAVMEELCGEKVPMPFDPFGFSAEVADATFTAVGLGPCEHDVVPLEFNMGDIKDESTWKLSMIVHLARVLEMAGSDPTVLDRARDILAAHAGANGYLNEAGHFVAEGHFRTMVTRKQ